MLSYARKDNHDTIIGGTDGIAPGSVCVGDCTLISGNYQERVDIHPANNKGIGNFSGVHVRGNGEIPTRGVGMLVGIALDNMIAGAMPQERNVISGSRFINYEIRQPDAATPNNAVQGNYIDRNGAGNAGIAYRSYGLG